SRNREDTYSHTHVDKGLGNEHKSKTQSQKGREGRITLPNYHPYPGEKDYVTQYYNHRTEQSVLLCNNCKYEVTIRVRDEVSLNAVARPLTQKATICNCNLTLNRLIA